MYVEFMIDKETPMEPQQGATPIDGVNEETVEQQQGTQFVGISETDIDEERNIYVAGGVIHLLENSPVTSGNISWEPNPDNEKKKVFVITKAKGNIDTDGITLSQVKTLIELSRWVPAKNEKFIEYKNNLSEGMKDKTNGWMDEATQTRIPLIEFSKGVHGAKGGKKEYLELVKHDLKVLSNRDQTVYLNAMIGDTAYQKTATGNLFSRQIVEETITDKWGNKKSVEYINITYGDIFVYAPKFGLFATLPQNINRLIDQYGQNTTLFTRLFLHFIEVRGKRASEKHINDAKETKVKELKANRTKRELWAGYIKDAIEKQKTVLYKEKRLTNIAKNEMERYKKNRTVDKEKQTTIPIFDRSEFKKDIAKAIDGCIKMGLLEKGKVFVVKKNNSKEIETICSAFPSMANDIKETSVGDGVCCIVTFNPKWTERSTKKLQLEDTQRSI